MPSTAPLVKDGTADFLAGLAGLQPADGIKVYSATPNAANIARRHVILGDVTAPQAWRGLGAQHKAESPSMSCWITIVKEGAEEPAIRAARAEAYALLAIIENGLKADPSAGGTIPLPRQTTVTTSSLEEEPVILSGGGGGRLARLAFTIAWVSHI
jgi:hypothetical protein